MRYLYVQDGYVVNIVEHSTTPDALSPEGYDIVPDNGSSLPGDFHPVSHNKPILAQIAKLEATQDRAVREVLLGVVGSAVRLSTLDGKIAALRITLL